MTKDLLLVKCFIKFPINVLFDYRYDSIMKHLGYFFSLFDIIKVLDTPIGVVTV